MNTQDMFNDLMEVGKGAFRKDSNRLTELDARLLLAIRMIAPNREWGVTGNAISILLGGQISAYRRARLRKLVGWGWLEMTRTNGSIYYRFTEVGENSMRDLVWRARGGGRVVRWTDESQLELPFVGGAK